MKSKLHYLLKGLTPDQKKELSADLSITVSSLWRITRNVDTIQIQQLRIIVPYLENVYGYSEVMGWDSLYAKTEGYAS